MNSHPYVDGSWERESQFSSRVCLQVAGHTPVDGLTTCSIQTEHPGPDVLLKQTNVGGLRDEEVKGVVGLDMVKVHCITFSMN